MNNSQLRVFKKSGVNKVSRMALALSFLLAAGCATHRTAESWQAATAKRYASEHCGFQRVEVGDIVALDEYYSVWV